MPLRLLIVPFCLLFAGSVVRAEGASAVTTRRVENLNTGWQFREGPQSEAQTRPAASSSWQPVDLPHTWNNQDGQDGGDDYYRGPGTYRRKLIVPETLRHKRVFLRFGAANAVADIYLNSHHLGQHRGGFSAFCFEVTDQLKFGDQNDLVVQVDNSHFDDVPPWSADFTFFGGLYRDVELIVTNPVCITPLDYASPGIYVRQESVTSERAVVVVVARISNSVADVQKISVVTTAKDAAGRRVARVESPLALVANAGVSTEQKLHIQRPHLWNGRSDPYLYRVEVALLAGGQTLDAVEQPLGLREFRVDPKRGLILNGRPLDLHGVNRHQDRLDKGWAIGRREHEQDIALIEEIGCTGVRLAHYQQDDYVYTLCDRAGLIVWAEIPLVNRIADSLAFRANCRQQLTELIRQNYNHPSIFFWGIHNEITAPWEPGPDPTDLVRDLNTLAKTEDPTRLTVCAATVPDDHSANWQTDLVAFNRYYGWYEGEPEDFAAWADRMHREHRDKAIGISEYGAGASIAQHELPVHKPKHDSNWHPEEWQAHLHEQHWLAMKDRPWLWCTFVWNMFDFASDGRSEGDTAGRNDKGLVTYDRRTKKDAFYWYKSNWSDEPVLYITDRRYVERTDPKVEVRVYSNRDEVTLYVNDRCYGAQPRGKTSIFTWPDVQVEPGPNVIRAVAGQGAHRIEDTCRWVLRTKP